MQLGSLSPSQFTVRLTNLTQQIPWLVLAADALAMQWVRISALSNGVGLIWSEYVRYDEIQQTDKIILNRWLTIG